MSPTFKDNICAAYVDCIAEIDYVFAEALEEVLPDGFRQFQVHNGTDGEIWYDTDQPETERRAITLSTKNLDNERVELTVEGLGDWNNNQPYTTILAGDSYIAFRKLMIIGQVYDYYLHLISSPTPELNSEYKSFCTPSAPIKTL